MRRASRRDPGALCAWVAIAGGGLSACSPGERPPQEHPLVRIDGRRCIPPPRLESPREAVAVMCAEAFVAHNGYTDVPPTTDTTQISLESLEVERSMTERLADRRNTLERYANGVCQSGRVAPGLTVAFRYRGDTLRRNGRAVTMTPRFDDLRVEHQEFILASVADSGAGCRRVAQVRGEIEERRPPGADPRQMR